MYNSYMYMYLLLIYLLVCCAKPAANDSLTWFVAYPMAHLDPTPFLYPSPLFSLPLFKWLWRRMWVRN